MPSSGSVLITVDLEDWFQVENLRPFCPVEQWERFESRLEQNTVRLLDLFKRKNVRATFFVLGWIGERFPDLIRAIDCSGHEIGSHGYGHRLCTTLSDEQLLQDLESSKSLLEEITAKPVFGYRAPAFSLTPNLMHLLHRTGFRYDSSYNDFALNARYGKNINLFKRDGKDLFVSGDGIYELPVSNLKIGGLNLPWGGGGYFRFWPEALFGWGAKKILARERKFVFYVHPWEIDDRQPRVAGLSVTSTFRHYLNLRRTFDRLERLIESFRGNQFVSCNEFIEMHSSMNVNAL